MLRRRRSLARTLRRKFRRLRQRTARQPPATCHSDQTGAEIMAETTYEIDHTMVGTVIGPANGWITALSMTAPPTRYDNAAFKADRSAWASGYFSVCGENDYEHLVRNLICIEQNNPCKRFVGLSIGFEGGLLVRSVPVGSQWEIVLSDQQPIVRKAA
jgi:hypothetical protein